VNYFSELFLFYIPTIWHVADLFQGINEQALVENFHLQHPTMHNARTRSTPLQTT